MQSTADSLPTTILNTNRSSSEPQILTEHEDIPRNDIITNILFGILIITFIGAIIICYLI